jgi:hypothetical protein
VPYNSTEYGGYSANFKLVDPTGEFIGPNGNGDPSGVHISVSLFTYSGNPYGTSGEMLSVQFQSTGVVPEPPSTVLAAFGAILISAIVFGRSRRAQH